MALIACSQQLEPLHGEMFLRVHGEACSCECELLLPVFCPLVVYMLATPNFEVVGKISKGVMENG